MLYRCCAAMGREAVHSVGDWFTHLLMSSWPLTQSSTPASVSVWKVYVSLNWACTEPVQRTTKLVGLMEGAGEVFVQLKFTVNTVRVRVGGTLKVRFVNAVLVMFDQ